MKMLLIPALLLAALPGPAVRFESEGVRLGDEVITGKAISLKSAGQLPVLVSGSVIENLSSSNKALEVAIGDKSVLLEVGVRLDCQGESYNLSTHGTAFAVQAGSASITGSEALSFKVTEKGFDFGKSGLLEGSALTAKVLAKTAVQDPPPAGQDFMSRRGPRSQQNRVDGILHRIFGNGDPSVSGEAADGQSLRMRGHVTPTNLP